MISPGAGSLWQFSNKSTGREDSHKAKSVIKNHVFQA